MTTKNLENLLTEYEQKRRKADMNLEERKQELYKKYPKLEEIDDEINMLAISKTRSILENKSYIKNIQN